MLKKIMNFLSMPKRLTYLEKLMCENNNQCEHKHLILLLNEYHCAQCMKEFTYDKNNNPKS